MIYGIKIQRHFLLKMTSLIRRRGTNDGFIRSEKY